MSTRQTLAQAAKVNPSKAPATKATKAQATKAQATKAPATKAPATKAPATKAPAKGTRTDADRIAKATKADDAIRARKAQATKAPATKAQAPARDPRPNAERLNETTSPDGLAAVMSFRCQACQSQPGTYCLSKLGVGTKHVHSSRMKQLGALTPAQRAKALKASADKVPQGPGVPATKATKAPATKAPATKAVAKATKAA